MLITLCIHIIRGYFMYVGRYCSNGGRLRVLSPFFFREVRRASKNKLVKSKIDLIALGVPHSQSSTRRANISFGFR